MTKRATGGLARRTLLGAAGLLLAGVGAAQAHHGWSGYLDEPFVLTGVVKAVHESGAHGEFEVEADGGLWHVVLGPPYRNRRAGLEDGLIKAGDEITAEGKRHRDPATLEIKTERLRVGDQVFDIYPERL